MGPERTLDPPPEHIYMYMYAYYSEVKLNCNGYNTNTPTAYEVTSIISLHQLVYMSINTPTYIHYVHVHVAGIVIALLCSDDLGLIS